MPGLMATTSTGPWLKSAPTTLGGLITKQRRDSGPTASNGERAAMTCDAQGHGEHFLMCDRCGLAWRADQAKPDCAPMTFKRMVEAIELEAESHEASHTTIAELQ